MDWDDKPSQEALSLARFRLASGRELLKLPCLYDVNLRSEVIPPLSARSEALALRYIASLAEKRLRGYEDSDHYITSVIPSNSIERISLTIIKGEKEIYGYWINLAHIFVPILEQIVQKISNDSMIALTQMKKLFDNALADCENNKNLESFMRYLSYLDKCFFKNIQ